MIILIGKTRSSDGVVVAYDSAVRTHLSLAKDAPVRRLIQRAGRIGVWPVLGRLHHQYVRI
jgi:hypothetical protein